MLELSDVHNMTEHGVHWWPAAVSAISPLAVVWDDPQGCEPVYCPSSCQFIRVRLFCGCGSCTADVLSDRAFDEHQKKVEACLSRKSLATRVEEIQQTRAGGRPHRPHPVPLSTTSISTPSHLSPPPLPPPSPPSSVSFSEESELLPPPPPPGRSHALQLMLSPFYRPRLHAHPIPLSPKHSHPPLPQTFPPPPPFPPPPRGGCSTTRCRTMSGANGASRARGTVDRSRRPRGRPQPMGRGAYACAE